MFGCWNSSITNDFKVYPPASVGGILWVGVRRLPGMYRIGKTYDSLPGLVPLHAVFTDVAHERGQGQLGYGCDVIEAGLRYLDVSTQLAVGIYVQHEQAYMPAGRELSFSSPSGISLLCDVLLIANAHEQQLSVITHGSNISSMVIICT
jgi:hypothetical protein